MWAARVGPVREGPCGGGGCVCGGRCWDVPVQGGGARVGVSRPFVFRRRPHSIKFIREAVARAALG